MERRRSLFLCAEEGDGVIMAKGLLIDYEFCTGCHSCEMACRKEHGLSDGEFGIKIAEFIWPKRAEGLDWQRTDDWQYAYIPVPLDECDLCAERTAAGKLPTCVHHCQAKVMQYGEIGELALALAEKPKQTLFRP